MATIKLIVVDETENPPAQGGITLAVGKEINGAHLKDRAFNRMGYYHAQDRQGLEVIMTDKNGESTSRVQSGNKLIIRAVPSGKTTIRNAVRSYVASNFRN